MCLYSLELEARLNSDGKFCQKTLVVCLRPFVRPLAAAILLLHRRLNQPSARKGSTGWRGFTIWSG